MSRRPLISLTPLIDMVFILLVFFMLASSFVDERAVTLEPPLAGSGSGLEGSLLIEINEGGRLRIAGEVMEREALGDIIRPRLDADPALRVVVKPGSGLPLAALIGLLDDLALIGVRSVSFMHIPV